MSLTGGKWQRKGTTDFQVDFTKTFFVIFLDKSRKMI